MGITFSVEKKENALSSSFQDHLSKSVSSRRAQKIERLKLIEKK